MEDVELVEKMLSGIRASNKVPAKKKDDLLKDISETRTVSLKEAIDEINLQIKHREKLHKEMMDDIEKLKSTINNMTPPLTGDNAKIIVEFQKKLIEAEEMKINEKLNCFRDIAMLKKEFRESHREYKDMEKRATLLGDLIDEE